MKAAAKAMEYEKTPFTRPLAKRKASLKMSTDMTKLGTFNIVRFLYRRHRADVWIAAFWSIVALDIWIKLG